MVTLEHAVALAAQAHAGQVDKAGSPYILHPLRVMLAQRTLETRIVAVFHDVLEDCPGWSVERLRQEGFTPDMTSALDALTKREGESYMAFVGRVAGNDVARAVKIADLRDNLDIGRLPEVTPGDVVRINKYKQALGFLLREDE